MSTFINFASHSLSFSFFNSSPPLRTLLSPFSQSFPFFAPYKSRHNLVTESASFPRPVTVKLCHCAGDGKYKVSAAKFTDNCLAVGRTISVTFRHLRDDNYSYFCCSIRTRKMAACTEIKPDAEMQFWLILRLQNLSIIETCVRGRRPHKLWPCWGNRPPPIVAMESVGG